VEEIGELVENALYKVWVGGIPSRSMCWERIGHWKSDI